MRRTKALVAGLRGSSSSATGWNAVVQAELAFASQGHTEAGARRMIETWAGHDGYAKGVGLALDVNVILTPPCIFH